MDQDPPARRTRNMNNCLTCAMRKVKCKPVGQNLCENCQKAGWEQCVQSHVPWRKVRSGFNPGYSVGHRARDVYDAQDNFHFHRHIIDPSFQGAHLYHNTNASPFIPQNLCGRNGVPHHYDYPFMVEVAPQSNYNPGVSSHQIEYNVVNNPPQQINPQPLPCMNSTSPYSQSIPAGPSNANQPTFNQTSSIEHAPFESLVNDYGNVLNSHDGSIRGLEPGPTYGVPDSAGQSFEKGGWIHSVEPAWDRC